MIDRAYLEQVKKEAEGLARKLSSLAMFDAARCIDEAISVIEIRLSWEAGNE